MCLRRAADVGRDDKSTCPGVYQCRECEKPFSVTVGTVFESSHILLHKWVYATHLPMASNGHIQHQLMRRLDVSYKTARFMFASHPRGNAPGQHDQNGW
jgi:transposase-like protein